ncbi:hypothetical protein SAMN05216456_1328 [Devosia crocina]|uniref:Uncharacterized protein n=1 Tax=Devosia crocina TaxID=429728 RepID=A0A1I7N9P9_9HYPH|nr:hypothetical protein [Devosia crocina]SFV31397.1 hypothetical protein SAMN05216456_1328 [Devosia crocina]
MYRTYVAISFRCPNCGSAVGEYFDGPLPDYTAETDGESENIDDHYLSCSSCHNDLEVQVYSRTTGAFAELIGHPKVPVDAHYEVVDWPDDEVDNYDPPDSPIDVYMQARRELDAIMAAGTTVVGDALYRMIFVQHFSAIEAYLADSLIRAAMEDDVVLLKMLNGIDELRTVQVSLADVLVGPELVKQRVRVYLRKLLYHNFQKIEAIFRVTFGRGLLPQDSQTRAQLFAAVAIRHDCTHRNGVTEEGVRHEDMKGKVQSLEPILTQMAVDVHNLIQRDTASIPAPATSPSATATAPDR